MLDPVRGTIVRCCSVLMVRNPHLLALRQTWPAASLSVAEAVEEPAEDAAFPGEGGAGWRCRGPLAGDRLVIVGPGDSVNDLGLVEALGAVDLRHVADQYAVAHDLGFQARGTVGVPLGFAAAGQRHPDAELAGAAEQVSVDATVAKGFDHPAGPEFVHATKLAFVPETSLNVSWKAPRIAGLSAEFTV